MMVKDCSSDFFVATVFCFVISMVCVGFAAYYGLLKFPKYCETASKKVYPGEQNLCFVPYTENKVKIFTGFRDSSKFSHYLYDSEPETTTIMRYKKYNFASVFIHPGDYVSYAFALPKGSRISAELSAYSIHAHWYFLDDSVDDLFRSEFKWKSLWDGYGLFTQYFQRTISQSRTYYLVCDVTGLYDDPVVISDWRIEIDYATYDLSNGEIICSGLSTCEKTNVSGKYVLSYYKDILSTTNFPIDNYFLIGDPKNKKDYSNVCIVLAVVLFVASVVCLVVGLLVLFLVKKQGNNSTTD